MSFDSIVMQAIVPPNFVQTGDMADTIRIVLQEQGQIMQYSDRGFMGLDAIDQERHLPRVLTLSGKQGVRMSYLPLGPLCLTTAGHQVVELSLSVFLGDYETSGSCVCALPPLSRLPQVNDSAVGLAVPCISTHCLPALSAILENQRLDRVFSTAHDFATDALLLRVVPETVTIYGSSDYGTLHQQDGWRCVFSSESKNSVFSISLQDPSWIDPSNIKSGHQRPSAWLTIHLLSLCQLDARLAYLIALQTGCRRSDQMLDAMLLETANIAGAWRPLWIMPLQYDQKRAGVTADTGEVCLLSESRWNKMKAVIWNT